MRKWGLSVKVSVKLHAGLAGRGGDPKRDRVVDIENGWTVGSVLAALDVSLSSARAIFLNAKHASVDSPVTEGDTLDVFPAIGGG